MVVGKKMVLELKAHFWVPKQHHRVKSYIDYYLMGIQGDTEQYKLKTI